jgi:hypothetical protein
VIVRLAEPEQTDGTLHGLVEIVGEDPVPFHGADSLLDLITEAVSRPRLGNMDGPDAQT